MIEYKICDGHAILLTENGELDNGVLRIKADLAEGSSVKLYGCEDGEVYEALTDSDGVAVFEKGVILAGRSYAPEFVPRGGQERISATPLSAVQTGRSLYLVRKIGNITYEFSRMWKVIACALSAAERAEQAAAEATEQVEALSKGYRTE